MYKQRQRTLTIISIIIKMEATSIHYIQAMAKHSHNHFNHYQVGSNLYSFRTSTCKALSQWCQWLSTPKQPPFTTYLDWRLIDSIVKVLCQCLSPKQPPLTTYKHWQSSFTIDSISINSKQTLIHLDSSTGKAVPQSIWSVSTPNQPWVTTWKHWQSSYHNWFNQYQLWSNLDSLPTSIGKEVS